MPSQFASKPITMARVQKQSSTRLKVGRRGVRDMVQAGTINAGWPSIKAPNGTHTRGEQQETARREASLNNGRREASRPRQCQSPQATQPPGSRGSLARALLAVVPNDAFVAIAFDEHVAAPTVTMVPRALLSAVQHRGRGRVRRVEGKPNAIRAWSAS